MREFNKVHSVKYGEDGDFKICTMKSDGKAILLDLVERSAYSDLKSKVDELVERIEMHTKSSVIITSSALKGEVNQAILNFKDSL